MTYVFQDPPLSTVAAPIIQYSGNLKPLFCMYSNDTGNIDCCVKGMYIEETPVFSLSSYMAPKLSPQVATQRKIL